MKSALQYCFSLLLPALVLGGFTAHAQLPSPPPDHIIVIVEENLSYTEILGPSGASHCPYINALAANPSYSAVFTNSYAITHPSQPNYLDLYAGSDQGTNGTDAIPTTTPWTTDNLGAQLLAAGKTFVTYSENMPSEGYLGTSSGLYYRKHNPVAYWEATGTPGTNQYGPSLNKIYPADFPAPASYSTLPTVSFLIPNSVNDMHDGTYPSSATTGDTWLSSNLPNLVSWALANNTLIIITFDEDDGSEGNQIATIFYGPMVKGGSYSEHITHYNVLRTIENLYGLPYAGNAATATTITDCWRASGTGPWLGINSAENTISFSVFPNPTKAEITFTSSTAVNASTSIVVCDAVGRAAGNYSFSGSSLTINTSDYAPGFYCYKVISENGVATGEGKFVIEK